MLGPPGRSRPGLLTRLAPGTGWVDMTSAAPELAAELAAGSTARGLRYLDAAVGGGPGEAARGALTLYVGGADADVQRLRPILTAVADASRIFHMGDHGAGYLTKLLVNQLWFGQALAVAEVMLLGTHVGVSPERLAAVLGAGPAASAFVDRYLPLLLAGDYVPAFGLARVVEELDSLARLADVAGTPWAVSGRVAELHRQALTQFGDVDGELLGAAWLEHLAGRRLADPPPQRPGADADA
jgi:3-hydroxyisobutyrate dehydrogenase-like beta-hydroxyacid dehydrogenase